MSVIIPELVYIHDSSVITVRRLWKKWNLLSTRQQKHSMETIYDQVHEICEHFPMRGAEGIVKGDSL
jgi:hypothetical protein